MRSLWIAAAAAMSLAGAAQAFPSAHDTVKDWTAACDNLGSCAAFGFAPDDAPENAYVEILRDAGPAAAARVVIVYDTADTQPAQQWTLRLDGRAMPGVGVVPAAGSDEGARARLGGAAAAALIDALRNGKVLTLEQAGKPLAGVSLAGSAAILLWVDADQGRVGTVTALAGKGAKPASVVPPPAAEPLIHVAPPVAQAGLPKTAPPGLIKQDDDCDHTDTPDDIVARLAPGVVLWGPECSMAAYNETSIFFLGDEHAGHLRRIVLPDPAGETAAGDDGVVNAEFDPKTQTLSSFDKGRGIGDCGSTTTWVWDGQAFELLTEDFMSECHGVAPEDWPPLFVGRRG